MSYDTKKGRRIGYIGAQLAIEGPEGRNRGDYLIRVSFLVEVLAAII